MARHSGMSCVLFSCFGLVGCIDASNSEMPGNRTNTTSEETGRPAETGQDSLPDYDFSTVEEVFEADDLDDMGLMIGNASGVVFTTLKGEHDLDRAYITWSATKMLTGLTIAALVEEGTLSWSDRPQDYIEWWTDDPLDQRSQTNLDQLLSFTSGLNRGFLEPCLSSPTSDLESCTRAQYDANDPSIPIGLVPLTAPGTAFSYQALGHYAVALMAERATGKTFQELLRAHILDPVGASATTRFANPSEGHIRPDGGIVGTSRDFALVMRAFLADELAIDRDDFIRDRTDGVDFEFVPNAARVGGTAGGAPWHYAAAAWLECEDATFSDRCATAPTIATVGAWGFSAWVDLGAEYFAVLGIENGPPPFGEDPAAESVGLMQRLQPLIEDALADDSD